MVTMYLRGSKSVTPVVSCLPKQTQSSSSPLPTPYCLNLNIQLRPGIKLLFRASPLFKPLHGFSSVIDAIEPQNTLGVLETKKLDIRRRLHAKAAFAHNRQLHSPGTSKRCSWSLPKVALD
jgi:hypothetical protein